MRVLLDARPLPGHRLGVAQYVLRLAELAARQCDLEVLAKASDVGDFPPPVHASRALPRPLRLAPRPPIAGDVCWTDRGCSSSWPAG